MAREKTFEERATEKHICSITGETYYGFGNNADPFFGRCSNYANNYYVLPARLMGISREDLNEVAKGKSQKGKNIVLKNFIDKYFAEHSEDSFVKQFDQMWEDCADDTNPNWLEEVRKKWELVELETAVEE